MKTHSEDGQVLDLEGLLYNMRSRIQVADVLADLSLRGDPSFREEALAMAIMNLQDDWGRFESAVSERLTASASEVTR